MQKNASLKIVKNIFSLTIGQGINLLLNFFSIVLAARYLGVNEFGRFSYLIAIVAIISKIIDFGLAPIVFREVSKTTNDFSIINTALILFIHIDSKRGPIDVQLKCNSKMDIFHVDM